VDRRQGRRLKREEGGGEDRQPSHPLTTGPSERKVGRLNDKHPQSQCLPCKQRGARDQAVRPSGRGDGGGTRSRRDDQKKDLRPVVTY
jgi:hypothetical protein